MQNVTELTSFRFYTPYPEKKYHSILPLTIPDTNRFSNFFQR